MKIFSVEINLNTFLPDIVRHVDAIWIVSSIQFELDK